MNEKCPHCGYCPHCGRSNSSPGPYYVPVQPYIQPYPYPWNYPIVNTGSGTLSSGRGYVITTTT